MTATPDAIKECFSSIAPSYDRMNSILSLAMHKKWNSELTASVQGADHLLDLCAGTGEIAFQFLNENPKSDAILLDFCPEMLEIADEKGKDLRGRFKTHVGDAQKIPYGDAVFDAVTIAYGIRNVADPLLCFREVYRVLGRGGRLSVLELTRPHGLLRMGHAIYLSFLPLIGKLVANRGTPYSYLAKSIQGFAAPELLMEQMSEIGFVYIEKNKLLGGVATLITATKC